MTDRPVLSNELIRLEHLDVAYAESLLSLVDDDLWMGMITPTPVTVDDVAQYIHMLCDDPARIPFVVIDQRSGNIVGSTCFYEYVPSQERIEIGSTFYARDSWGGYTNPSCKLLMFEYAFTTLKVRRVALRCDARNDRSIAAIKKLGATYEGTLREHRIAADGTHGDTMYFSVIVEEWPDVRQSLVERIASVV